MSGERTISFLTFSPPWGWGGALPVVVALLVLGGFLAAILARRSEGARRRLMMATLSSLYLILIALVLGPEWVTQKVRYRRVPLLLMVDSSLSMQSGKERSRLEAIRNELVADRDRLTELQKSRDIELWMVGAEATLLPFQAWVDGQATAPEFPSSSMDTALGNVMERQSSDRLTEADVVMVSDWIETVPAPARATLPFRLASARSRTVVLSDLAAVSDLSIARIESVSYGYAKHTSSAKAIIENRGAEERAVTLSLYSGDALVASRSLTVKGKSEESVSFQFLNGTVGEAIYRVELKSDSPEESVENNTAFFRMRILQDKIRVLHVCGQPSWDQRFMRDFLRRDPEIELISFYILRTLADDLDAHNSELSLMPFPYEDLFSKELDTFDVVIFQNFNSALYFRNGYLSNLEAFVRKGGGFLMLGGEQSFSMGGYAGTPLSLVLPVALAPGDEFSGNPFRPKLPAGTPHPILRGLFDAARLGRLPMLPGLNRVAGLAEGAKPLLLHPTERALDGAPLPALTVREIDKGRSAAVLPDAIWRWKMTSDSRDALLYETLVKRVLRWLTHDPQLDDIQLRVEEGDLHVVTGGMETELTMELYTLLPGQPPRLDQRIPLPWVPDGTHRVPIGMLKPGTVRVDIKEKSSNRLLMSRPILIPERESEHRRILARGEAMESAARRLNATPHTHRAGSLLSILDRPAHPEPLVIGETRSPLTRNTVCMGVTLALFLLFWFGCRRWLVT